MIFVIFSGCPQIFINLMQLLKHIESIYYRFIDWIYCCLFAFESGESIYDPPQFRFIL